MNTAPFGMASDFNGAQFPYIDESIPSYVSGRDAF